MRLRNAIWACMLMAMGEGICLAQPETSPPVKAAPQNANGPTNYDEEKAGGYQLPDPLLMQDGTPVRSVEQWEKDRRPEIMRLYEKHIHGKMPGRPADLKFEVVDEARDALGGRAVRKQVDVHFSSKPGSPVGHLLVYTPAKAKGPVPTFLCLSFSGNWKVTDDPAIRFTPIWDRKTMTQSTPTSDTRGSSKSWDVPLVLSRGYGIAVIHYGDIEPDFEKGEGLPHGVRPLFYKEGQTKPAPDEWGAIGAWAWGLSRCLDYLETDKDVDAKRVIGVGQSRLGKTILWAGATDQRYAMIIASCSGEMGAALGRRNFGETIDNMTSRYLYQFAENFKVYNGRWDDMPVDSHFLIALIAPRPLLLNTGSLDRWSDPKGEFLGAQAASPVYSLFDKHGLDKDEMPALDKPLLRDVGFHEHTGQHDILKTDWPVFLDFADMHLKPEGTQP